MRVSPLKRAYFWSIASLVRIRYGDSCSTCAPTRSWLYCRIIVAQTFEKVSVSCMGYYKGSNFSDFYFIYDGNAFIVVFKAVDTVIDN